ncbi:MAG TPA: ABC transporter substrate-binding protein [Acidimicrobiales bacterium]
MLNKLKVATAAGVLSSLAIGVTFVGNSADASSTTNWSTVQSVSGTKGMAALVATAKAEGHLNVITLPLQGWANYGAIMKDFTAKYGIKINDENPNGSSANEITAVENDKGRAEAPDVLDVGTSYAVENTKLLAPYKVQTWSSIPAATKDANGRWFDDYGGYVSIGCNTAKIAVCPTSFADLAKPMYKNEVGINGDPTQASAAFAAVMAASLANGGSFNNVEPGIKFFANLNSIGNYVPGGSAQTAVQGTTPILIWWDYLQNGIQANLAKWKVIIPTDASYAAYYTQAITADAPHPAAARLWEEYLYSVTGQNLFLQGYARPIELAAMTKANTVNKSYLKLLPAAPKGVTTYPTLAQLSAAKATVAANWASEVGAG